jgi:lipopolysaccharide biosynthesis protein
MKKIRPIAIYLPQFHPIPENDKVWGKGFTEWTNVAKAKPRFRKHYQPRLPADLGYYDLRLDEVREEQAKLAKEYAIEGFCYYHYWFNGKRLLERPFNEIISNGKPDFNFMLCWANENWTKRWDGKDEDVIAEQHYSESDDIEHINYLINIFKDPRYIRIDNKPVFVVYKSHLFPDMKKTIKLWRQEASKADMELYLCRMEHGNKQGKKYLNQGFDAAIEFQPYFKIGYKSVIINRINLACKLLFGKEFISTVGDYGNYVKKMINTNLPNYKRYPCVTPMWDNSSRRVGRPFFAFKNSKPNIYKDWINGYLKKFKPYSSEENLFFINAWNEWAEGNYLEPDKKWGRGYLEATKEAFENFEKLK